MALGAEIQYRRGFWEDVKSMDTVSNLATELFPKLIFGAGA
jgi:hypothetical protein